MHVQWHRQINYTRILVMYIVLALALQAAGHH